EPSRRDGEVQLRGAELQVALPLVLRIEAERDHREEVAARVRIREVVDVLRGGQALRRERWRARLVDLEALREDGGVAAGQVRADLGSRRARAEHRTVPDVTVDRVGAAEGVVLLREPPDVVVAERLS